MMKSLKIKPTIIIPDAAPLVHLAAGEALHVLTDMGKVVLVDVIVLEVTYYQNKPFAKDINHWIENNASIEVAESDIGILYRMALEQNIRRPRNAGEIAIAEWLADRLAHIDGQVLVVYENGMVPSMLIRQGVAATVAVVTTRNFLSLAQEQDIIPDAEFIWKKILTVKPTANPLSILTIINPVQ